MADNRNLSSPANLSHFIVENALPTVYYVRNFISEEEESYLIDRVLEAPKPKWDYLSNRRLQNWGGILSKKGSLIISEDIPDWLRIYMDRIVVKTGVFLVSNLPNHVLVNEYLPGQGILPHTDGPAFFPTVTTISLESHAVLDFYKSVPDDSGSEKVISSAELEARFYGSLLLEPRSLVIIKDEMYTDKLHGIAERRSDIVNDSMMNLDLCALKLGESLQRGRRISLTIRNVPKTAKHSVQSLLGKR